MPDVGQTYKVRKVGTSYDEMWVVILSGPQTERWLFKIGAADS